MVKSKRIFFRERPISLIKQKMNLLQLFPEARCVVKRNLLIWKGEIKPTPLSRSYQIKIIFNPAKSISLKVILYGEIPGIERVDFPHYFHKDVKAKWVEICLYRFREFDYRKDLISYTIVPWIADWLLHYELWLATGEWLGGGHESPNEKG